MDSIDAVLEFTKTWDWLILEAGKIENISADQRTEYINSLTFLKEELGENFPKKFNINHPFFQKILLKVSKNGLWVDNVTPLVNTLRLLRSVATSRYEKLKGKLVSNDIAKHREGMYFINVAQSLGRMDLTVRLVDEEVNKATPDFEIMNPDNGDKFYVEITRLALSVKNPYDELETQRIVNKIAKKMKRGQLPKDHAGLIYVQIEPIFFLYPNLNGAVTRIISEVNKYAHLMGVVVYAFSIVESEEQRLNLGGGNFYGKKMIDEITTRDLLFVCNQEGETILKSETIKKVVDSFL